MSSDADWGDAWTGELQRSCVIVWPSEWHLHSGGCKKLMVKTSAKNTTARKGEISIKNFYHNFYQKSKQCSM